MNLELTIKKIHICQLAKTNRCLKDDGTDREAEALFKDKEPDCGSSLLAHYMPEGNRLLGDSQYCH